MAHKSGSLSTALWALSRLNHCPSEAIMESIGDQISSHLPHFGGRDLAQALSGYAYLGELPESDSAGECCIIHHVR